MYTTGFLFPISIIHIDNLLVGFNNSNMNLPQFAFYISQETTIIFHFNLILPAWIRFC